MAAPSPISSLAHSPSLATAGVCLLVKYEAAYIPTTVLALSTSLAASLQALAETDFKM